MQIDRLLESLDLTWIFTALTLLAMFLSIYVMQQTSHANEDRSDHWFLRWMNRVSLAGLALALLWSLSYSQTKSWQPWPPGIATLLAVIVMLAARALAVASRARRIDRRSVGFSWRPQRSPPRW